MYKIGDLSRLTIGRLDENGVNQIRIDMSEWLRDMPDAVVGIWNTRYKEIDKPYPVITELEGDVLVWDVRSYDTEVEGTGAAFVVACDIGNKMRRSRDIMTVVDHSEIGISSSVEPMEWPWYIDVNVARDQAMEAAKQAAEALERVEGVIQTEGAKQVLAVQMAGIAQAQAVQEKGDEVLKSIPKDYTELEEEVTGIKSDMSALQNTTEAPAPAGKVWTATNDGAGWANPTGGGGDIIQDPADEDGGIVVPGTLAKIDKSLTLENHAADARAVGNRLRQIGKGLASAQIDLLEQVFLGLDFVTPGARDAAVSLIASLRTDAPIMPEDPPAGDAILSSITAAYSGGSVPVGTDIEALRTYIVVTGHYSDGSTRTLTGYNLEGTISAGSNSITVLVDDKSATITVVGQADQTFTPYTLTNGYAATNSVINSTRNSGVAFDLPRMPAGNYNLVISQNGNKKYGEIWLLNGTDANTASGKSVKTFAGLTTSKVPFTVEIEDNNKIFLGYQAEAIHPDLFDALTSPNYEYVVEAVS